MVHGPVDFIMVAFEGAEITPDIAAGMTSLTQSHTIHIIDLIFVQKDNEGVLTILEVDDLPEESASVWNSVIHDVEGILTPDDATILAADLPNNRSAVLVLYENTWAREMSKIITDARGEVLAMTRIPRGVMSELEAGSI